MPEITSEVDYRAQSRRRRKREVVTMLSGIVAAGHAQKGVLGHAETASRSVATASAIYDELEKMFPEEEW